MNAMEAPVKTKLVAVELISAYQSMLEKMRRELPKIEPELVMAMLKYQTRFLNKTPWAKLEIVFNPSIESAVKKEELFEKTGRCAEIRHGNVFVIDTFITLQNLEELARDEKIDHIEGSIIPI